MVLNGDVCISIQRTAVGLLHLVFPPRTYLLNSQLNTINYSILASFVENPFLS